MFRQQVMLSLSLLSKSDTVESWESLFALACYFQGCAGCVVVDSNIRCEAEAFASPYYFVCTGQRSVDVGIERQIKYLTT